jgi:hypothetical protein
MIAPEFQRVTAIADKTEQAIRAILQETRSIESLRKELEAGG